MACPNSHRATRFSPPRWASASWPCWAACRWAWAPRELSPAACWQCGRPGKSGTESLRLDDHQRSDRQDALEFLDRVVVDRNTAQRPIDMQAVETRAVGAVDPDRAAQCA